MDMEKPRPTGKVDVCLKDDSLLDSPELKADDDTRVTL